MIVTVALLSLVITPAVALSAWQLSRRRCWTCGRVRNDYHELIGCDGRMIE